MRRNGRGSVAFFAAAGRHWRDALMNGIIYLVGLVVIVLAILSFLGMR